MSAPSAMAADTTLRLVHRRVDGWLLGGLGIIAWLLLTRLPGTDGPVFSSFDGMASWVLVIAASAHFGASYHLAYGDGRAALARNPVALVWTPLVLAAAALGVLALLAAGATDRAAWAIRWMLVAVFTLTGWHYIKQAYGVAMLTLRQHGIPTPGPIVRALRYGFYPIWFVDMMDVWVSGTRASYRRYDVGVGLFPTWVEQAARGLAGLCVIAVVGTVVALAVRAGHTPPLGAWGPYVAAGLWFVLPPTNGSATAVIAATHAIQYLTCVHRAEVEWAKERGETNLVHWWLCVMGGAAAGGYLLGAWLPQAVESVAPAVGLPSVATALLFVGLNLHHYAIDASMWRSSGQHVRRILGKPGHTAAAA